MLSIILKLAASQFLTPKTTYSLPSTATGVSSSFFLLCLNFRYVSVCGKTNSFTDELVFKTSNLIFLSAS
jgi:hypothetical protein